jgi:hypothetical protein
MCVREEGTADIFAMWALHDLVGKSRVDTAGGVFLDLYETRSRSNANQPFVLQGMLAKDGGAP